VIRLPPTQSNLEDPAQKPYFLWWCDLTVAEFRDKLREGSSADRAYWLGALLREANTRDVWLFTTVKEVTELWPELYRHLGRSRELWQFLLQLPPPQQEPRVA